MDIYRLAVAARFLVPTFLCGRQRKVGAAPHRGEPDRPKAKQGEANAVGEQPRGSLEQTNKKSRKGQRHKQATNAVGKKNPLTPY
jgi:hypothetical protein